MLSSDGETAYCVSCAEDQRFPLDGEYRLVDLRKTDQRGNPLYLIVRGTEDGRWLVLWFLSPGFRGSASYDVEGQARIIGAGLQAQGDAGRMGGAACPLVLVDGPCRLMWERRGRLYGTPPRWVAEYDGEEWTVRSADECAVEDAALEY
jgi:hypothetical protein